eukprot:gene8543-10504_t
MPLFETINIDIEKLRSPVKEHWGVDIDTCLKSSQNHTYLAKKGDTKYILRITPDPRLERIDCTELELGLLEYLDDNKLPVSRPIRSSVTGKSLVKIDDTILCLFNFATGEPVVYQDWKWMTTKEIVVGLGKWFGNLHKLSRQFTKDHPELASKARLWDTLHDSVLAGTPIDEKDQSKVSDQNQFGIIHGDVNPSNYFWDSSLGMPSMFDWDQVQLSWYLYDLSSPIWGVVSIEKSGSPLTGLPVPEANSKQYIDWLLEGYEPTLGEKVDRDSLDRMVLIRRELYKRFCKRAVIELPPSHPMHAFCKMVNEKFEKEEQEDQNKK